MKFKKSLTSIIIAISSILLAFVTSYLALNFLQRESLQSCVNEVGSDIVEYSKSLPKLTKNDGSWYVLNAVEAKAILSNEIKNPCSKFNFQPQDMTNNEYQIAVRGLSGSSYEVIVWSKGFDNISGTKDDIIFPSGEKPPH
jgi:hypothetical protein